MSVKLGSLDTSKHRPLTLKDLIGEVVAIRVNNIMTNNQNGRESRYAQCTVAVNSLFKGIAFHEMNCQGSKIMPYLLSLYDLGEGEWMAVRIGSYESGEFTILTFEECDTDADELVRTVSDASTAEIPF